MMESLSAPAVAQDSNEPYVRVAEIEIDPAQLDAYKAAVKEQIEAAIRSERRDRPWQRRSCGEPRRFSLGPQ